MIAREWKCRCPAGHRPGFLKHLQATGVADTVATSGFCGYQILVRDLEDAMVEVTLTTYWTNREAMLPFAGEDATRAVLYPGDEAFAIVPETAVQLYEVVGAGFPACGA
jgi:hypothetical protein